MCKNNVCYMHNGSKCVGLSEPCLKKNGVCSFFKTSQQVSEEETKCMERLVKLTNTRSGTARFAKILEKYPSVSKTLKNHGHYKLVNTVKRQYGISS